MIRPARPDDVATIERIVDGAYRRYVPRMGKQPGPMLDDYARRVADREAWVLEADGAVRAVLVLEDSQGGALLLDNIAVDPAAQGQGHGRALIAFAEEEGRRRGRRTLRLYTHVAMTENLALYARLGFRETGRICEKGYERVYMAKALGQGAGLTAPVGTSSGAH